VDLVDDDVIDVGERPAELLAGEHRLQGLGGRDEDVRRVLGLSGPLVAGGVAVSDVHVQPEALPPPLQALAHVPVERSQRGDVQRRNAERNPRRFVVVPAVLSPAIDDGAQHREHRGLRLAGARGGDDQRVPAGHQRRDRAALWLRRAVEPPLGERRADRIAQPGEDVACAPGLLTTHYPS